MSAKRPSAKWPKLPRDTDGSLLSVIDPNTLAYPIISPSSHFLTMYT